MPLRGARPVHNQVDFTVSIYVTRGRNIAGEPKDFHAYGFFVGLYETRELGGGRFLARREDD